jgi:hypothetical protein
VTYNKVSKTKGDKSELEVAVQGAGFAAAALVYQADLGQDFILSLSDLSEHGSSDRSSSADG